MWDKLFIEYATKVQRVLPKLFNMAELESKRGKTIGMEVGTTRERVIIALFMYIYGAKNVKFPPTTSHELDCILSERPVSIKTKLYNGNCDFSGVKMSWTVDWDKVINFIEHYQAKSDMLYVSILWGGEGALYLIPKEVQQELLQKHGVEWYCKLPKQGTNYRGIEISRKALETMTNDKRTRQISIKWQRDKSLLVERALYGRWMELWDAL